MTSHYKESHWTPKIVWLYLQSRNREIDTDVENKCVHTKEERGVGGLGRLWWTHIRYWHDVQNRQLRGTLLNTSWYPKWKRNPKGRGCKGEGVCMSYFPPWYGWIGMCVYLADIHIWLWACQASLSMGFSSQEYWREFQFPSPGDLPDPRTEPGSTALQVVSCTAGWFFAYWATREAKQLHSNKN